MAQSTQTNQQETHETIFRRNMLRRMALFAAILYGLNYAAHFLNEEKLAYHPLAAALNWSLFLLSSWLSHQRSSLHSSLVLMFLGIAGIVVTAFILRGGLQAPAVVILILFPVLGYTFAGSRAGTFGALAAFALTALLYIADRADWVEVVLPFTDYSSTFTITLLTLTIFSTSLGYTLNRARKAAERRLVETSGLVNLGIMAGGIAHEINNPLAIIQGYVHQLVKLSKSEKIDKDKLTDSAARILEATNRVATIINGLVVYSRDLAVAIKEPASINAIMEHTLRLCRERFARKGITLQLSMPVEQKMILAHPMQMSQAILNVLNNAHDAVENEPVKDIKVAIRCEQDHVVLSIADSGQGIAPNIRDQIFVPFFTTKEVGKGTGLGLSIASSIVSDHGGELVLMDSLPTTFLFRLPAIP